MIVWVSVCVCTAALYKVQQSNLIQRNQIESMRTKQQYPSINQSASKYEERWCMHLLNWWSEWVADSVVDLTEWKFVKWMDG